MSRRNAHHPRGAHPRRHPSLEIRTQGDEVLLVPGASGDTSTVDARGMKKQMSRRHRTPAVISEELESGQPGDVGLQLESSLIRQLQDGRCGHGTSQVTDTEDRRDRIYRDLPFGVCQTESLEKQRVAAFYNRDRCTGNSCCIEPALDQLHHVQSCHPLLLRDVAGVGLGP